MDLKVGDIVSSMWTNFAKTGNPNGPGLPEWPVYDQNADRPMEFGDTPKAEKAPIEDKLNFITEFTDRAAEGSECGALIF